MGNIWSRFYKKNRAERLEVIEQSNILEEEYLNLVKNNTVLEKKALA